MSLEKVKTDTAVSHKAPSSSFVDHTTVSSVMSSSSSSLSSSSDVSPVTIVTTAAKLPQVQQLSPTVQEGGDLSLNVTTVPTIVVSMYPYTPSSTTTQATTIAPFRPIWKLTTKKQLLFPGTTSTTSTTSTTVAPSTSDSPQGSNPWDLLRVSGCNIYGTFYKVDETIKSLSSECKRCFCSAYGVQCNKVC